MLVNRNWFYEIKKTLFNKGVRFRNFDKPNQNTFENLTDSVLFKTEKSDRAKEDIGEFDASVNGHVVLATDAQVIGLEDKPTDRSLVVQPSQTTTVSNNIDFIGDFIGNVFNVVRRPITTRKEYFFVLNTEFKTWLLNRLIPSGGFLGQVLTKNSNSNNDVSWKTLPTIQDFIPLSDKGANNGVVPLDNNGQINSQYLASFQQNSSIPKLEMREFGQAYVHTSFGDPFTEYPNIFLASFEATNVDTIPDIKIDSLPVVSLFNSNLDLEVNQIEKNTFYVLVKQTTSLGEEYYNILGLPSQDNQRISVIESHLSDMTREMYISGGNGNNADGSVFLAGGVNRPGEPLTSLDKTNGLNFLNSGFIMTDYFRTTFERVFVTNIPFDEWELFADFISAGVITNDRDADNNDKLTSFNVSVDAISNPNFSNITTYRISVRATGSFGNVEDTIEFIAFRLRIKLIRKGFFN